MGSGSSTPCSSKPTNKLNSATVNTSFIPSATMHIIIFAPSDSVISNDGSDLVAVLCDNSQELGLASLRSLFDRGDLGGVTLALAVYGKCDMTDYLGGFL